MDGNDVFKVKGFSTMLSDNNNTRVSIKRGISVAFFGLPYAEAMLAQGIAY